MSALSTPQLESAPSSVEASSSLSLVGKAMAEQSWLAPYESELADLLDHERHSHQTYLEQNSIDRFTWTRLARFVCQDLGEDFFVAPPGENDPARGKKIAAAANWIPAAYTRLRYDHARLIEKSTDAQWPIAERLEALRFSQLRVLPLGYLLHPGDWQATKPMDDKVDVFMSGYARSGGKIEIIQREMAKRKSRFADHGRLFTVVRTREVALLRDVWPEDTAAEPGGEENRSRDVLLRKRSIFALPVDKVPDLEYLQHLERQVNQINYNIKFSDTPGQAWTPGYNERLDVAVQQMSADYQSASEQLLVSIEQHIAEQREPLIPLATSYSFRQRISSTIFPEYLRLPARLLRQLQ